MPLLLGTLFSLAFGYAIIPAVVVGSLLASHTLLGLPILRRLGATRLEPVIVTIGATVLSDTLSLVVFAVCISTYMTGFFGQRARGSTRRDRSFVPLILFGLSRVGAYALSRVRSNEDAEFVLMLGIMAIAGVLADVINLPGIVGAFLAGLAVNAATRERAAKAKLDFFGKALFIPCFFVATGFLIDPIAFVLSVVTSLPLVVGIIATLMLGKWIAATIVGRAFGYTPPARLTTWALTLPQVAATLAATLVAYHTVNADGQRLLDERMLNAVLVLMLVTSILGPILTERFAPRMLDTEKEHPSVVPGHV